MACVRQVLLLACADVVIAQVREIPEHRLSNLACHALQASLAQVRCSLAQVQRSDGSYDVHSCGELRLVGATIGDAVRSAHQHSPLLHSVLRMLSLAQGAAKLAAAMNNAHGLKVLDLVGNGRRAAPPHCSFCYAA